MPITNNTRPESVIDKNGHSRIVHKGRGNKGATAQGRRFLPPARKPLTKDPIKPAEGDKFSVPFADSIVDYVIREIRGEIVYATATDDNEYGLGDKVFLLDEVESRMLFDRRRAALFDMDTTEQFWHDLPEGAILHYDSGFKKLVRCEVRTNARGEKYAHPIALVGDNWEKRDLPRRREDGSIDKGYYASFIDGEKGDPADKAWRPNPSNFWESASDENRERYNSDAEFDPINLSVVDLSIPEPTQNEVFQANVIRAKRDVVNSLEETTEINETIETLRAALRNFENLAAQQR